MGRVRALRSAKTALREAAALVAVVQERRAAATKTRHSAELREKTAALAKLAAEQTVRGAPSPPSPDTPENVA